MANQITGIIELIQPTEKRQSTDGTKTFFSRQVIINARRFDPYTGTPTRDNYVAVEFNGEERCKEVDKFKPGQLVTASFMLDGVRYADKQTGEIKYFTHISCYKMELTRPAATPTYRQPEPAPERQTAPAEPFPHQPFPPTNTPPQGDLPF